MSVSPEEDARRRALHTSRHSDAEIARRVGISKVSIYKWRKCRGLPCNYPRGTGRVTQRVKSLIKAGVSNDAIVHTVGCRREFVRAIRWRLKQPDDYAASARQSSQRERDAHRSFISGEVNS